MPLDRRVFFVVIATMVLAAAAPAATINVPGDQSTIQAGINVAVSGQDEVVVAPGTYTETIDFNGKVITVRGSGGADVTTIDGNGVGPVVTFATSEGSGSVRSGAGVLMVGASPSIVDCVIALNDSDFDGGGMAVTAGSDPTLSGVTFAGNTGFTGGAMFMSADSSLAMTGGGFIGNAGNGGAAAFISGTATFTGTTFIDNTANFDGGAINCQGGSWISSTACSGATSAWVQRGRPSPTCSPER